MEEQKTSSTKSTIIKVVIVLAIAAITLFTILSTNDINEIMDAIKNADYRFILVALGLFVLYVVINPISLHILSRKSGLNSKFRDNFMVSSVEFFFNGITPFAVGGQPFQVFSYKQLGVPVSKSTGLIMLNYVVYQMSICIMCLLSLVYYKDMAAIPGISVMLIVGFAINFLVLAIFILLGTSKTARNVMVGIVNKLFSISFLKKFEKNKESFQKYCDDAQFVFKEIFKQIGSFILCIISKLIALSIYFVIPLAILKALGVDIGIESAFYVICMTTFSIAMTCFIPTPGASGGIEFAFKTIFATIAGVTGAVAISGMLLWRFITYYCLMLFSFCVYLILGFVARRRNKKNNNLNNDIIETTEIINEEN